MEYFIIGSDKFKVVRWSGGTSKELFIFPSSANYQQRNFQFRLSTATVEVDKSDFTSLLGVSRKLMVLSGKITLFHKDHYSKQLNKFDVDSFEGDWKTSCIGKCIDFNLMTTGNRIGELTSMEIQKEQDVHYKIKVASEWICLYVYAGKIGMEVNGKMFAILMGDLIVLHQPTMLKLAIKGIENSELIFVEIAE